MKNYLCFSGGAKRWLTRINRSRRTAFSAPSIGVLLEALESRTLCSAVAPVSHVSPAAAFGPAVSPADDGDAPAPAKIAISASGQRVVAYISGDSGSPTVQLYDASGNATGDPIDVSDDDATEISVATNAAGDFVVAWNGGSGIMVRKFDASGNPLTDEIQANSDDDENPDMPAVGMDDAGNFVVTWTNTVSDAKTIVMHQGSATEITQELDDNNHIVNDVEPGDTEEDDETYDDAQVLARRFDTGGNPLGDEFRVDQPTGQVTEITQGPSVVVSPTGGFTIGWGVEIDKVLTTTVPGSVTVDQDSWFDDNDNEHDVNLKDTLTSYTVQSMAPACVSVCVRSYDAGGNARGNTLVLSSTTDTNSNTMDKYADIGALDMAGDAAGDVVVAWQIDKTNTPVEVDDDGTINLGDPVPQGSTAYFQVLNPSGGSAGKATTAFATKQFGAILNTQVAMSLGGSVTIAAEINDDNGDNINVRQYNTTTKKLGAISTIDWGTVPSLVDVAVATNGDWDFVAPDDSSGGVISSTVQTPKPNLVASFGTVKIGNANYTTGTLPRGGNISVPLTITNTADATADAVGPVEVELFLSTSPTLDGSAVALTLPPKQQAATINLKPGKSAKLNLKAAVPADLPVGSYYLIARINGNMTIMELDFTDNLATTSGPSAG